MTLKYIIKLRGEQIAAFCNENDAKDYMKEKREELFQERYPILLDRIAVENGLDRRYPGTFPTEITQPYFKAAQKVIEQECIGMFVKNDESDHCAEERSMRDKFFLIVGLGIGIVTTVIVAYLLSNLRL